MYRAKHEKTCKGPSSRPLITPKTKHRPDKGLSVLPGQILDTQNRLCKNSSLENETYYGSESEGHAENDFTMAEKEGSETEDEEEDALLSDMPETELEDFGITLTQNRPHQSPPQNISAHSLYVTNLQHKAATFILTSGPACRGLSEKMTHQYLCSLDENGDVRKLWNSGTLFWKDHRRRQELVLKRYGEWKQITLTSVRADISKYTALVRFLPSTIVHLVTNAKYLSPGNGVQWKDVMQFVPEQKMDAEGVRILDDLYSGDDLIYLFKALAAKRSDCNTLFLPLQLFIDKANVTRLNKRSMYPVVLYILCFSRQVRRHLAVNIAFIPVVSNLSSTGKKLSSEITKQARCSAIQQTMHALLGPLKEDLVLDAVFPDRVKRTFTPVLFSIVADLPEMAVLYSMRYGVNTAYPCSRCHVQSVEIDSLDPRNANVKQAGALQRVYRNLCALRTKGEQNRYMKALSLRNPPSVLLSRFEYHADTCTIAGDLSSSHEIPKNCVPYGLSSLMKFEAMHNFDLGITADLLRAIENYFAVTLASSGAGASIVDTANSHQLLLPRQSSSDIYRLPSPGTIIAERHANVNALQYKSALCVLPFLLNGSLPDNTKVAAGREMYNLMTLVLCYLDLHHYVRRINAKPWHIYESLDSDISKLLSKMDSAYRHSIGRTKGRTAKEGPADIGASFGTLKSHQLYKHLLQDIKGCGLVGNFDAQAGESHHVQTRAHYSLTSRRANAENTVAARSTTREPGVIESMYPVKNHERESAGNTAEDQGTGESSGDEVELSEIQRDDGPRSRKRQKARGELMDVNTVNLDGLHVDEFQQMLVSSSASGPCEGYVFRSAIKTLRTMKTVRIAATFPWCAETGSLKGAIQRLKATSSFYNTEPHFDFIEFVQERELLLGQARLFFSHPYLHTNGSNSKDSTAALVRVLKNADSLPENKLHSQDEVHGMPNSVETPINWFAELRVLLRSRGCRSMAWELKPDGTPSHAIVRLSDVMRAVSVIPDFNFPLGMEPGSKHWKQITALNVERDGKRFKKEEANRLKRISILRDRGPDYSCVPRPRRPRSTSDGPDFKTSPGDERFFYNPYMLWSSPT